MDGVFDIAGVLKIPPSELLGGMPLKTLRLYAAQAERKMLHEMDSVKRAKEEATKDGK